eukprot:CAMPEP_0182901884 /NCGR_PEP_ID=MMETSP0034_2-20130328/30026_1 /TAXON_ID=156128 /ORGANISM="Nephroselmis pyriformis, Strain CCMP717" /LENGTH=64 /DNA_ID=CAMNT_0025036411 /DNA_START=520 /DNA_END=714 /DNA_ORIENTATION=+
MWLSAALDLAGASQDSDACSVSPRLAARPETLNPSPQAGSKTSDGVSGGSVLDVKIEAVDQLLP